MSVGLEELEKKLVYIIEEYKIPIIANNCFLGACIGAIWGVAGIKKKLNSSDVPNDILSTNREKFYSLLCEYCDKAGYSEVQLYDRACISKAVYSNIRSMSMKGKTYIPSKVTVMCLCIALRLNLSQAQEMLNLVGYSFSNNLKIDKIIAWCLEHDEYEYDVKTINDVIYDKLGESPFLKFN